MTLAIERPGTPTLMHCILDTFMHSSSYGRAIAECLCFAFLLLLLLLLLLLSSLLLLCRSCDVPASQTLPHSSAPNMASANVVGIYIRLFIHSLTRFGARHITLECSAKQKEFRAFSLPTTHNRVRGSHAFSGRFFTRESKASNTYSWVAGYTKTKDDKPGLPERPHCAPSFSLRRERQCCRTSSRQW